MVFSFLSNTVTVKDIRCRIISYSESVHNWPNVRYEIHKDIVLVYLRVYVHLYIFVSAPTTQGKHLVWGDVKKT